MIPIKLAFDIDDVIARIMPVVRSQCLPILGRPYQRDLETSFDLKPALGLVGKPNLTVFYVNMCLRMVDKIEIDPYARLLTEYVYSSTKRPVLFITARPHHLRDITQETIKKFITVPYKIIFTKNKEAYIPKGYAFVEDRRKTVINLSNHGIKCFLVKNSYNRFKEAQKNRNIIEVDDLAGIVDYYLHLKEGDKL